MANLRQRKTLARECGAQTYWFLLEAAANLLVLVECQRVAEKDNNGYTWFWQRQNTGTDIRLIPSCLKSAIAT